MVALGFYFIALFAVIFWDASHRNFSRQWLLHLMLWSLPLPWVAAELGWVVAEYGRQPWAIDGVLPTFLASSSVSAAQVLFSLAGFILFYSSLARRRLRPDAQIRSHGTGASIWAWRHLRRRPSATPAE